MKWRHKKTTARADPLRIAELEWELFGIQPTPGTMAAAVVGCRRLSEQFANPALLGTERR